MDKHLPPAPHGHWLLLVCVAFQMGRRVDEIDDCVIIFCNGIILRLAYSKVPTTYNKQVQVDKGKKEPRMSQKSETIIVLKVDSGYRVQLWLQPLKSHL